MAKTTLKKKTAQPDADYEYERLQLSNKPGSLPYIWKRVRKDPAALISIIFLVLLIAFSLLSPYIVPYSYKAINPLESKLPPFTAGHLLGTDEVGRDILSRVLYGARYTILIGIGSTVLAFLAGAIIGAIAGYYGGLIDSILMRFLDVFQSFPNIAIALLFAAVFGAGFINIIYALAISSTPPFARMMRAQILSIQGSEYVEAAQSINCSTFRTIVRHIIPNAISPAIVQITMNIANAGLRASALSFLGFGVKPPTPEWGAMLSTSRNYMRDYPHMVIIPGLFIMLTVLAFSMIGDAVRDAMDPKLKN